MRYVCTCVATYKGEKEPQKLYDRGIFEDDYRFVIEREIPVEVLCPSKCQIIPPTRIQNFPASF